MKKPYLSVLRLSIRAMSLASARGFIAGARTTISTGIRANLPVSVSSTSTMSFPSSSGFFVRWVTVAALPRMNFTSSSRSRL